MAKHAVTPHIPVSDSERLLQATQILKACIVANDTSHPFEINPSCTLQAVYCLVQDVIEHRGDGRRKRRPGEPPKSITGRLQQAASILRLCIISNDADPYFDKGFDFSYPMHIVVALIDEIHLQLGEEMDKRLRERPTKLERRELQFLRATKVPPDSTEGKPN
jgi:hypothetical protein